MIKVTYTVFDAEPLGLQPLPIRRDIGAATDIVMFRRLGFRLDERAAREVEWLQSKEFRNVGTLHSALGLTFGDFWDGKELPEFAALKRRILIQGLRASDEYVEFPIDESFEPFQQQLQTFITEAERQQQAQLAVVEQKRQAEAELAAAAKAVRQAERERCVAEVERRSAAREDAYRPGSGIEIPQLLAQVKPQYTADAMRAKIQGVVGLECVVDRDGGVGRCEVTRSLDPTYGLDQEALKAARQWRFRPGTRCGEPVPVLVTVELTFTLR